MKFSRNGIDISYSYHNAHPKERPTVVFIHGFPLRGEMWKNQADALKDKLNVLTFDLRGLGDTRVSSYSFTQQMLCKDLKSLLDNLSIEKVILCGLSMGGYIAQHFTALYPQYVQGLILCDTRASADSNAAKEARTSDIRLIDEQGVSAFIEAFIPKVLSQETLENSPNIVASVRKMLEMNTPEGLKACLMCLAARPDLTEELNNIKVPTLIIVGEQDKLTPPEDAEKMSEKIQNAQLILIRGAGHFTNLENEPAFNSALLSYIARFN